MRCDALRRPPLAARGRSRARVAAAAPARAPDENFRVLLSPNKSEITKAASARDSGQSCQPSARARPPTGLVELLCAELVQRCCRRPSRIRSWRAPQVGDPAPDFSATSHTGATVTLKDYAGKRLILVLPEQARRMNRGRKSLRGPSLRFTSHNVAILGCSADPVRKNKKFADEHKFGFPLLSDTHMAVATTRAATSTRAAVDRRADR